jgi:urocanate hydratase
MSGVSRRAWARNPNAIETVAAWNGCNATRGHVTVPAVADEALVTRAVDEVIGRT